jgi:type II secretory pathway component PulM
MIGEKQIIQLRDRWERLTQRERASLLLLGGTSMGVLAFVGGVLLTESLASRGEENAEMRQALREIETKRDSYNRDKDRVNQIASKISTTPVQLQGYLEQAAKDSGVEIPESNEQQPQPAGKNFIQRSVDIRLRSVKLDALGRFLKKVETGKNLVMVTALQVRTRDDKHEELDVEMTVSTFERATKKDQDKDKGKKG